MSNPTPWAAACKEVGHLAHKEMNIRCGISCEMGGDMQGADRNTVQPADGARVSISKDGNIFASYLDLFHVKRSVAVLR